MAAASTIVPVILQSNNCSIEPQTMTVYMRTLYRHQMHKMCVHTSACIPSITAPFPFLPTASFKLESMAAVFSGCSLGKMTVDRKEVVPCLGNAR